MPNRAPDWFRQAQKDLEQAEDSRRAGRHEWACFAAQQAAEKAVRHACCASCPPPLLSPVA
jgi:HEPN domain-containing protein